MQLLVLGCHRSGTSACTRLLNMMGASVGAPESMKAANKENPKGFWENDEVVDINKLLLQMADARWDRVARFIPETRDAAFAKAAATLGKELERLILRFDVQRPWVTKDPRLCLTLPFWLPYLEKPVVIIVNRDPEEVARSMNRRNPLLTIETGIALWEKYTLQLLEDSLGVPRILVKHEDLLHDPVGVSKGLLERLEELGVTGLRMPADGEISAFIDTKLHREHAESIQHALLNSEQRHLLEALENGDALNWSAVPALSQGAVAALGEYEEATENTPERLLAVNRWNLGRLLDSNAELLRLHKDTNRLAKDIKGLELRGIEHLAKIENLKLQIRSTEEKLQGKDSVIRELGSKLAVARKAKELHDDLRTKYSELFGIEHGLRQEVESLRESIEAMAQCVDEIGHSRSWRWGLRIRMLLSAIALQFQRPEFPVARAQTIAREALAQSHQTLRDASKRMRAMRSSISREDGILPNLKAYAADVKKLEALFVRMARSNESIDRQGWWRAGVAIRKLLLVVGAPRDLKRLSADAQKLWSTFNRLARDSEGRARRSDSSIDELNHDRESLFELTVNMYGLVRRKQGSRWWRWCLRARRIAGKSGLMKRDFRFPNEDAEDTLRELRALKDHWKRHGDHYEIKAERIRLRNAVPVLSFPPRPVKPISKDALYFAQVDSLTQQDPDTLTELIATSEKALLAYRGSYSPDAEQPLVSIIMPAYNRADIIREAIQSVLDQTWQHWELLVCDDGSKDNTVETVEALKDPRIRVLRLEHGGAAKARNAGLTEAQAEYIAYLDSDNLWHPAYLEVMVGMLMKHTGQYCAFAKYLDVVIGAEGGMSLKRHTDASFNYEDLEQKNFIDLNSFVHRASLYREFGGFTDALPRMQDWDLVLKYTFLRDPLYVDAYLAFYRRNAAWGQITHTQRHREDEARGLVRANLDSHYAKGMPVVGRVAERRKVTIVSWDICRNHFSKAYNLAEALHRSGDYDVQLVGFRFFDEPIFEPYVDVEPPFETLFLQGSTLPEFETNFARALMAIKGDLVYCVKPRFPSLGLGLLANYHFGKPLVLESNDSEVHVHHARGDMEDSALDPTSANADDEEWRNPHGVPWSRMMDGFARQLPFLVTHNVNLDNHYGSRSFYIRNLKDEEWYDPSRYDRDAIRKELGFKPSDRVILFGGLIRKHKGVFTLVDLVQDLGADQYKLLFVGSRNSPDLETLKRDHSDKAVILPPQGRNDMARINYAADLVVLWLDPDVPASRYQMPYKLTDALAMKVPVIANDISDLGILGQQGYLRLVPHGDMEQLKRSVRQIFEDPDRTAAMVEAGRKLYLRQFCYAAAKRNFDLIYDAATREQRVLPTAIDFAKWYAKVHAAMPATEPAAT